LFDADDRACRGSVRIGFKPPIVLVALFDSLAHRRQAVILAFGQSRLLRRLHGGRPENSLPATAGRSGEVRGRRPSPFFLGEHLDALTPR
jgi:hypothetical protein